MQQWNHRWTLRCIEILSRASSISFSLGPALTDSAALDSLIILVHRRLSHTNTPVAFPVSQDTLAVAR